MNFVDDANLIIFLIIAFFRNFFFMFRSQSIFLLIAFSRNFFDISSTIYLKRKKMSEFVIEDTYENILHEEVVLNDLDLDQMIKDANVFVTTTSLNDFSFAMIITKLSNFFIEKTSNDLISCNSTKAVDFSLSCNSTATIDFFLSDESTKTIDFLFYQSTKTIDVFLFYQSTNTIDVSLSRDSSKSLSVESQTNVTSSIEDQANVHLFNEIALFSASFSSIKTVKKTSVISSFQKKDKKNNKIEIKKSTKKLLINHKRSIKSNVDVFFFFLFFFLFVFSDLFINVTNVDKINIKIRVKRNSSLSKIHEFTHF
jgi:hypothetical protein